MSYLSEHLIFWASFSNEKQADCYNFTGRHTEKSSIEMHFVICPTRNDFEQRFLLSKRRASP